MVVELVVVLLVDVSGGIVVPVPVVELPSVITISYALVYSTSPPPSMIPIVT